MTQRVKLAVLGAGLIGKRHIQHVLAEPSAQLSAVVDPSLVGETIAKEASVKWFTSFADMVAADRPDGIIVATPNQAHVQNGLEAVEAGVPALIEKPIADDIISGEKLIAAAEAKGVPLLAGHHRRHNPVMQKAKEVIESGKLGRVLVVNAMFWLFKPDDYFDISWRRERGAGPVFLNLIHDVDNLRYLFGDVAAVQARESNAVRGNAVEETAVILIEFKNGVLGTATVSDSVVAPWSWEMTTGENPAYPRTEQSCYMIGGTHGSLAVPSLEVWRNPGKRSWWEPLDQKRIEVDGEDPLVLQIRQFCNVIRGDEPPLVSGREGLETLRVIDAVKRSAATGERIKLN
ncbi:MAG: Gfo/Idh/MocA family oxidoreductase [Mesorhizobium sp.]|uniref:Gfo/Idh/MocA family protein n=1 Tax=unclassified Mesorhizobium TaxID=325217 RepID=UPI000FE9FACF|nr:MULTISPECIES: Gfo/Idh/MocA family oxidoreductase [unclassified Mesorhizobium]RWB26772.1 MAG: Gfo/Idh/MocA family oxidoreductase [Mesorhizobium sp.]RWC21730.1 MAG: Gfo/Idh/MocA family oxidoreductase [Mesorhizobium sp.]RWD19451.1 MAG: Gfo/Idh/MocA family oxidoreductase [Mesorhizobium sp.]RWD39327.1 MAG: Gfo/Idh/MocA family oxidoreductase [Mesorhizobium sp.]RWD78030.1 MAG: Gfo/Idh/MocA family oxidoreductase [Mesorhizobium sp.]